MRILVLVGAVAALLAGCTNGPAVAPISANPLQDVSGIIAPLAPSTGPSLQGTVTQGLLDASWNLDQAVAVGALDAQDAAPACLHSVLGDLGIDPANPATAAPNFTPHVSDLISGGSVIYIRARQAEKAAASGGPTFSLSCKALIGQFVIDAGKLAQRVGGAMPGIGQITSLLKLP